jgi:hypothetical protein
MSRGDLLVRQACGMNDATSFRHAGKAWGFVYIDSCFRVIYQHDPA